MHTRVLADGFSPLRSKKSNKKLDKNIGHHPKKKKKECQKCSNVYTFFTSTLKEITALAHNFEHPKFCLKSGTIETQ